MKTDSMYYERKRNEGNFDVFRTINEAACIACVNDFCITLDDSVEYTKKQANEILKFTKSQRKRRKSNSFVLVGTRSEAIVFKCGNCASFEVLIYDNREEFMSDLKRRYGHDN